MRIGITLHTVANAIIIIFLTYNTHKHAAQQYEYLLRCTS